MIDRGPKRQFMSMREIAGRRVFKGLDDIDDLVGHMTRRGLVKSFVAGVSGLTVGCKAGGDSGSAGHTGTPVHDSDPPVDTEPPQADTDTAPPADTDTAPPAPVESFDVGVWVNISTDDAISVVIVKNEMGQGIATAFAMMVAEELDVTWDQVSVRLLPEMNETDLDGWSDGTWGSTSVPDNYEQMRRIGAAARQMLMEAAADRWGVEMSTLSTAEGVVSHADHGALRYGELAEDASLLEVPLLPDVKDPSEFTIIGTEPTRVDARDHALGTTTYGIDVVVEDMVYAAIRQSPVFGGSPANLDELSVEGTGALAIVPVSGAVAVIADSWWTAKQVVETLDIEWDLLPGRDEVSTEVMEAQFDADLAVPGTVGTNTGDVTTGLAGAAAVVEATYTAPMLAHAPMEPPNATVHVTKTSCEIWIGTQYAKGVRSAARSVTGLPESSITVHTMPLGGGFGRKAETDFATQAVTIAAAVGRPVKLIWSRSEDLQHDYFRPPVKAWVRAGVDAKGNLVAWEAQAAGCSYFSTASTYNLSGFDDLPYFVANQRISWVGSDFGLPFGYLRAPGHNKFCFMIEAHVDRMADAAGMDPAEFRLANLGGNSRMADVLQAVLDAAGWGKPAHGGSQGCAIMQYGTDAYVAHVAEVSVDGDAVTLHSVHVAVDIGTVIHPDIVRQQVEGSAIYTLATGLLGKITLTRGQVDQSNFHDYRLLKLSQSPEVHVTLVESDEHPGGIGEHACGGVIPAVANALRRASGVDVTTLPITEHGFSVE